MTTTGSERRKLIQSNDNGVVFIVIVKLALQACAENKKRKARNIIKFIFRALVFHRYFRQMFNIFGHGERSQVLIEQPKYLMKCMIPFLHVGLSKQTIIELLDAHYDWLESTFTESARKKIYLEHIVLNTLEADDLRCHLTLNFDVKVRKEGELALSLIDDTGYQYYTLAFTCQNNSFHIGCIQGSIDDNGFSHAFTKAFHGMRPKSFMVESLRLLAQPLHIQHIYAVKNESHIYNAKRYHGKAQRFNLNYDQLWEELDGVEHDQWFYELPLVSKRRPLEEIKRSRRKTYRMRYEWLEHYQCVLSQALSPYLIEKKDYKITS
ncbi:VirK/YbjX family protein [Celerinatantimonas yamalensis]|uniref:DUF535 family protein n=1 Tax=Celerinatantimonas yamalensis TaxID=559956 RepID=A0ABW9G7P6_9GAMM